jgi:3-methyl-2-oxobutanoate hydroxymethyltransferase
LTAYDASFASVFDQCGVDIILVGDSLGNVIKGSENTLGVSMKDHFAA